MPLMKAVRIHGYGDPDVLTYEEAPRPTAKKHEVLIRVQAASVNPFDAIVRAGSMVGYLNPTFPYILGTDAAGIVEEVGAGVTQFAPGDRVYGRGGMIRDGTYAEYAVLPAKYAASKPTSLDYVHAAALPHVALTAWQALMVATTLSEGQTVLIHGAAGGVGHIAVQLAKSRGAKVIGTASANIDFLRELRVDQAIDYSTTAFEDIVHDVDVVLDTVGGDTQERSWQVLKRGGILISTTQPPAAEIAAAHGVHQHFITSVPPAGTVLAEVATLVDAGQIKPEVSMVLPLEEARKAHELIEGGHTRGKIVLQVVK